MYMYKKRGMWNSSMNSYVSAMLSYTYHRPHTVRVHTEESSVGVSCPAQTRYVYIVFTLILCLVSGESGLGKSTLVNSLFLTDLYPERQIPPAAGEQQQLTTDVIHPYTDLRSRAAVAHC